MSRYQGHSRSRSKSDREALFPLLIILGCLAYSHKVLVSKIEHLVPTILVLTLGLVILVVITRFIFLFRGRIKINHSLINEVDEMTGLEFEEYVANLLKKHGYTNVRLTEKYDYGIDIIALKDGVSWGIQVKRHSGLVKADAVRQAVTALKIYKCDRAMVVTNSYFSKVARKLANTNNCYLIDRNFIGDI